jgi:glutamate-5-semialdehyde dehydrogenase
MAACDLTELGRRAKAASQMLAATTGGERDAALHTAAGLIEDRADELLARNAVDVERSRGDGLSAAQIDRLTLTAARVGAMADGLRSVAGLPDPVGEVVEGWVRPNGLRIERVRVPLGVVGIIYENRPNVTSDAAALCIKSANAVMLRGSSSALESNLAIVGCLSDACTKVGLPDGTVTLVTDTTHEAALRFMQLDGVLDCLVPRGGHQLVASVRAHASVPYVIDGDGNCHVYVDESADLDMALSVLVNAKTQRPGVCNSAESLLVHEAIAEEFLPRAAEALRGVELRGDARSRRIVPSMSIADEADFAAEYLGLILSVAVVSSLDAAVDHIRRYGSGHSEAIITRDLAASRRFCRDVDAAAVIVNASTRFVDGGELGLGAEIGISTQKLHARGPMGLRELTCVKYVIHGDGQVRA